MVMSRHRNIVQRLPSLSCPNVMPCYGERLKVRLTTVPLNAALKTTRLKVGRREWPQRAENWPPRTSASAVARAAQ